MLSKILGGTGRVLMTAGTLILLFVAYQLWGTGLQEAKAQKSLKSEFADIVASASTVTTAAPTTTAPTTTVPGQTAPIRVVPAAVAPALPLPQVGDPVAQIEIPKIGITRTVVEGTSVHQLARGPAHYPATPLPGQKGNVAIAGHRTTYGQPFHNIDKLEPGDQIKVTTVQGEFVYKVIGTEIVRPRQVEVLEDKGDNRLTLTACHPKYSLRERIIVSALLEGEAAPEIAGQKELREEAVENASADNIGDTEGATIDGGLSGERVSRWPAIWWGVVCALIWFLTWLVQMLLRRRARHQAEDGKPSRAQRAVTWTPYLVGFPLFMVALYVFFENFVRLLPGNY